jgi:hypothetical protein
MGGVINVAIRLRDGRAFCQERWTNNMPHWFQDPKMFDGDEEHVMGYINMVADNDWIANPHAPGTPQPVENSEYGLIVWDFMTGTILDNNHYSQPSSFDPIATGGDMLKENFTKMADAGRIFMRTHTYPPRKKWPTGGQRIPEDQITTTDTDVLSPEDAKRLGEEAHHEMRARWRSDDDDQPTTRVEFMVKTDPMTYYWMGDHSEEYDEDTEQEPLSAEYLAKLKEIGFPMTEAEGLNAHLPYKMPTPRKITQQEEVARDLYQEQKPETHKGIGFDDLTTEQQQEYLALADKLLDDPAMLRQWRLQQLLGSASTVVTIGIKAD